MATQVLIPTPDGGTVPLGQVAKVSLAQGPSSIRTENAQLALYIFVDLRGRDLGGYVEEARKAVASGSGYLAKPVSQAAAMACTTRGLQG